MPNTIHRYMEGIKSILRFHGVEISNEQVKQKVTLPVAEEIAGVPRPQSQSYDSRLMYGRSEARILFSAFLTWSTKLVRGTPRALATSEASALLGFW